MRRGGVAADGCVLVLLLLSLLFSSCQQAYNAPLSSVDAVRLANFSCGPGQTERVERWGHSGASRGCYRDEVRDGRIIFWEEGYLNLAGSYSNGAKDGTWTVYNGDGSVFCDILFEEGVKKDKIFY
jgi:hypothetical protein